MSRSVLVKSALKVNVMGLQVWDSPSCTIQYTLYYLYIYTYNYMWDVQNKMFRTKMLWFLLQKNFTTILHTHMNLKSITNISYLYYTCIKYFLSMNMQNNVNILSPLSIRSCDKFASSTQSYVVDVTTTNNDKGNLIANREVMETMSQFYGV